jgi:hypothetical protein
VVWLVVSSVWRFSSFSDGCVTGGDPTATEMRWMKRWCVFIRAAAAALFFGATH